MSNHLRFAQDNVPADELEKKGRINGCCGNQGNGQACHRGTRPARGGRYRADRIEEVPEPEFDVTDKENTKPGSSRDSRQTSRASARPQSSRDSRQASRASTAQSYGDSDVSSDDDVTENQTYITEGVSDIYLNLKDRENSLSLTLSEVNYFKFDIMKKLFYMCHY